MIRPYVFVLDPTPGQIEEMRSHCGAARVAYNWCLAQVRANWDQRRAEESYGIPECERTPWIETSAYSLRKAWNAAKDQVAPWWRENSKEAYATGCANLSVALKNRKDGRARMPRFKSKHRWQPSCRFTTGSFGLVQDRRHVQLPVIGVIRTTESTRKLARKIEAGTARIRSVTLSLRRGRWQVSFSVDLSDHEPTPATSGRVVGVDLGIKELATLSTGEMVQNARHLEHELTRLRRAQRKMSRRRRPGFQ
jgi:putative transposase